MFTTLLGLHDNGPDPSDNFTGSNGDPPNANRWDSQYCTQLWEIQSNRLYVSLSNSQDSCIVLKNPVTSVLATVNIEYSGMSQADESGFRLYVMNNPDPDAATWGTYIEAVHSGALRFYCWYISEGVWSYYGFSSRSEAYGQLRFNRTALGVPTNYGADGVGAFWPFEVGLSTVSNTEPFYVMLRAKTDSSGTVSGSFDNFTVS